MPKPIRYINHALDRMADPSRDPVSADEVESVLAAPDVSYTGVDGKSNVLGAVNGKRIRVCFDEDARRILVFTVVNRGPT